MAAATSATMALPSCSASTAAAALFSDNAVRRSPVSSLKAVPALPRLRRQSPVSYGSPSAWSHPRVSPGPTALFGGGGKGTDEKKPEKKFITKDEEPEQYWTAAAEREGKNPMQTLLPYIFLLTILSPFAILAVAYFNGWIKTPN